MATRHRLPHVASPPLPPAPTVEQVAFADKLLLNKTDLVDERALAQLERRLHKINAGAQIIECQYSK